MDVKESLFIILGDARRIGLWATGESLHQEGITALLHFVSAVIEDAVGDAPRIAANHSREFTRLQSLQPLEGLFVPWIEKEAKRIEANASAEKDLPIFKKTGNGSEALASWISAKAKVPIIDGQAKSPSESLDNLMKLTGLEKVKKAFLDQYHLIGISFEQGSSGPSNLNTVFSGNPGIRINDHNQKCNPDNRSYLHLKS